jgi:hypothetical protein
VIETRRIVAVAWHRSRTPFLLRIVALLRQAATFLLRNGYKPQNSAVFCRSVAATGWGFIPSYRSTVAASFSYRGPHCYGRRRRARLANPPATIIGANMTAHYLVPGAPTPPPPAPQANSYIQPKAQPQTSGHQPTERPAPLPAQPPPQASDQEPHHSTLFSEWRAHHGDDWVRADALHPTVRRLIDDRDRISAIRQRLRQLAVTCSELEAKVVGNAARPVTFYRVIESETA